MSKSILITGCSSGIGLDAAMTLHARGWRVFASCRKDADCERLRGMGMASPMLDVASSGSIAAALDEVLSHTDGKLDALFNNAAFGIPGAVEDLPRGALESLFETNLFGLHELTRAVIPTMRHQGHGRILNCSSVLGFVPLKWRGAYVSSKYALEGLTDTLRLEMRDTPIHVISIQPGPITSKIRENSVPHFEKWIDWKASPRAAQYEGHLVERLYAAPSKDPFELPASAVSKKLVHALEAARPKARYKITTPTFAMAAAKRLLPLRVLDWIVDRG